MEDAAMVQLEGMVHVLPAHRLRHLHHAKEATPGLERLSLVQDRPGDHARHEQQEQGGNVARGRPRERLLGSAAQQEERREQAARAQDEGVLQIEVEEAGRHQVDEARAEHASRGDPEVEGAEVARSGSPPVELAVAQQGSGEEGQAVEEQQREQGRERALVGDGGHSPHGDQEHERGEGA
jgi:hypothetical protein